MVNKVSECHVAGLHVTLEGMGNKYQSMKVRGEGKTKASPQSMVAGMT